MNKVGQIETLPIEEDSRRKIRRGSGMGGDSGNNNGKRGGGGGSGGDRRSDRDQPDQEQFTPSKYYIAMWVALLAIMMTFAMLVGAYVFISFNRGLEWKPFDLPIQIFVSTFLILASSVTFEFAKQAIKAENQKSFWTWLLVTTGLGAAFISSQLFVWFELWRKGVYVSSNPYAGFFYILTVTHAVHLVGGIVALGYLVLRAVNPTRNKEILFKRQVATNVVGMYWHSMDVLWLVLLGVMLFLK